MATLTIKEERFHPRRKKSPSFSSSLLDAICHSIDESHQNKDDFFQNARIPLGCGAEEDIARHRRQIMVEKWMEIQTRSAGSHRYFNSDSSSSADSTFFSSSETESAASRSTPKLHFHEPNNSKRQMLYGIEATPKYERKLFMRTKSKALKIYGDLMKVKQPEPISPGAKITNFLNSLFFNSRNLKKNQGMEDSSVSGVRSRSVKDSATGMNKPAASSTNKPKRSVKFCPVSVIVDDQDHCSSLRTMPKISSQYIKKNIDSFREYGLKQSDEYHQKCYEQENNDDGESCTSSDLFEIENIGIVGIDSSREEELPVFGTTFLKMNQAIATGMVV